MSTRCNVALVDKYTTQPIIFYRHSDGYPEGVKETLDTFVDWINKGLIRNNASQAAGWLILLGMQLYADNLVGKLSGDDEDDFYRYSVDGQRELREATDKLPLMSVMPQGERHPAGWKIGAYEPTNCCAPDINYFYIVYCGNLDLFVKDKAFWKTYEVDEDVFDNITPWIDKKIQEFMTAVE